MAFESDRHVQNVNIPILILHEERDLVVPYRLGKQVFELRSALPASSKRFTN